mgnify:CR=1 FL=1
MRRHEKENITRGMVQAAINAKQLRVANRYRMKPYEPVSVADRFRELNIARVYCWRQLAWRNLDRTRRDADERRIAFGAIGELAGEAAAGECPFANRFAGFAGSFSGARCVKDLARDFTGFIRIFQQKIVHEFTDGKRLPTSLIGYFYLIARCFINPAIG